MIFQKIAGVCMIIAGAVFASVVSSGVSIVDRDASGAVLLILVGALLLFAKRKVLLSSDDFT